MMRMHRAILACGLAAALAPAPAGAARAQRWEVTFALRVTSASRRPFAVRLALPRRGPGYRVGEVEIAQRGLKVAVEADGDAPHVRFEGRMMGSRRLAVTYRVGRTRELANVPPIRPVESPQAEILPYVRATPLLQSRSILVREFLETHVTPALRDAEGDLMRAIFAATRRHIRHDRKGKTLVLDVVRSRRAQRLGIERAFTTFLRCARIPARLVEGVDLSRKTKRKRVFWTEVWAKERWWPVSASGGWIGRLPTSHVALTRDGVRVLETEGEVEASYRVESRLVKPHPPTPAEKK